MSENPSYYPAEHYQRKKKPKRHLEVWIKLPIGAYEMADLFRGFAKAGWTEARMYDSTYADGDFHRVVLTGDE